MKVLLKQESKYFTTQESEASDLIQKVKNETDGEVKKQTIDKKNHSDYGEYFEVTILEEFTTSKSVLENGY